MLIDQQFYDADLSGIASEISSSVALFALKMQSAYYKLTVLHLTSSQIISLSGCIAVAWIAKKNKAFNLIGI